jgi:hypothetical protein
MPLDTRSESKSVAATDPSPDRRGRRGPRLAALAIAATAVGGAIYGGILSRVDAEKLAMSESEYVTRFTSPTQTDWVMRCTARKVLRLPEDLPIKAAAKAQLAA